MKLLAWDPYLLLTPLCDLGAGLPEVVCLPLAVTEWSSGVVMKKENKGAMLAQS